MQAWRGTEEVKNRTKIYVSTFRIQYTYYKLHKVKVHFTSICMNCHCSKNTFISLKEKKDLVKAVSNSLRRSWDHRVPAQSIG